MTMLLTKRKVAMAAFLAASMICFSATLVTYRLVASQQGNGNRDAPQKPTAKEAEKIKNYKDAEELQGEWQAVDGESNGKKIPSYEVRSQGQIWIFKGDEVAEKSDSGYMLPGTRFKLDPSKSPKAIDITWFEGSSKGQTMAGIYALEKGRLWLCFALPAKDPNKRPTEFKTHVGDGLWLQVLERTNPMGARDETGLRKHPSDAASEEFGAVLREWKQAQQMYDNARRNAKTAEERRKVEAEKPPNPEPFAERCLRLAEGHADTSAALAALCWAVSQSHQSEACKKALATLKDGRITRANLDDLDEALTRFDSSRMLPELCQELAPLVLSRIKQKLDHPAAARLLKWVCNSYYGDGSTEVPPPFAEAADLILDRFADSPDIANFCECLGSYHSSPPWAGKYEKHLRTILNVNRHRYVRVCAQFALATVVQSTGQARQAEAEVLYRQFIKDYDGQEPRELAFLPNLLRCAKAEIEEIRVRGLGRPAPEIEGQDLEGKPMRLSDYNGKVVLLHFWAFW